jgi:dihydropteroate synthase
MIWQLGSRVLDFAARVQIMGILNVTPDSFFDGGRYQEHEAAVQAALKMVQEGADIIDVGGESSRPPMYGRGEQVSLQEECKRVVPVVEALRRHCDIPISVDTTKAEVARQALRGGADIINDISALRDDPGMLEVAATSGAPVVLMHRRGSRATMQQNTRYQDLLGELKSFLIERLEAVRAGGVAAGRMAVDPGIGFGKSIEGNFEIIRHLDVFAELGCPVLVGASRKSFIWKSLGLTARQSLEGSLAVAVLSVVGKAHILRVHDVGETVRAVRLTEAILSRGGTSC